MTQRGTDSKRVALITGGSARVGRAIAELLASEGFDIAITYLHNEIGTQDTIDALTKLGAHAHAIHADLTTGADAVAGIAEEFTRHFSRLDVLVNNASIYEKSALEEVTAQQFRRFMAIHVEAPLLLCQRFADLLRASSGHVIMMADVLAERPWPDYVGYCVSKGAMESLTINLARALAPQVTVNAIAPSVVHWPDKASEEYRQRYLKRIPLGRAGTTQDVAELVHFLCTEGTYITGQILHLDGGYSIT